MLFPGPCWFLNVTFISHVALSPYTLLIGVSQVFLDVT